MSNSKNYSVAPHDEGWQVKRDGAARASDVFGRKSDAVERGRELARASEGELRIKGQNGRIQNPNSFGNDPIPPKDKRR